MRTIVIHRVPSWYSSIYSVFLFFLQVIVSIAWHTHLVLPIITCTCVFTDMSIKAGFHIRYVTSPRTLIQPAFVLNFDLLIKAGFCLVFSLAQTQFGLYIFVNAEHAKLLSVNKKVKVKNKMSGRSPSHLDALVCL